MKKQLLIIALFAVATIQACSDYHCSPDSTNSQAVPTYIGSQPIRLAYKGNGWTASYSTNDSNIKLKNPKPEAQKASDGLLYAIYDLRAEVAGEGETFEVYRNREYQNGGTGYDQFVVRYITTQTKAEALAALRQKLIEQKAEHNMAAIQEACGKLMHEIMWREPDGNHVLAHAVDTLRDTAGDLSDALQSKNDEKLPSYVRALSAAMLKADKALKNNPPLRNYSIQQANKVKYALSKTRSTTTIVNDPAKSVGSFW